MGIISIDGLNVSYYNRLKRNPIAIHTFSDRISSILQEISLFVKRLFHFITHRTWETNLSLAGRVIAHVQSNPNDVNDLDSLFQSLILGVSNIKKRILERQWGALKEVRPLAPELTRAVPPLPKEIVLEILKYLTPTQIPHFSRVEKTWKQIAPEAQIRAINQGKLSFLSFLKGMTAEQAVQWLISNPSHKNLEYADFRGFTDFNNECLEKLTKNCPNLKHLFIKNCKIEKDALKHLKKVPGLQSLNVKWCGQLEQEWM